jgi:hypothetical protein
MFFISLSTQLQNCILILIGMDQFLCQFLLPITMYFSMTFEFDKIFSSLDMLSY